MGCFLAKYSYHIELASGMKGWIHQWPSQDFGDPPSTAWCLHQGLAQQRLEYERTVAPGDRLRLVRYKIKRRGLKIVGVILPKNPEVLDTD